LRRYRASPVTEEVQGFPEALYLLNHWGIPVPPQSLGKPCTSFITGETLYLLNHWIYISMTNNSK
jgi:hypothetical protein